MMTRRQEQPEEDATVWSVRHNPYSYRTLSDVGDLGVVKDLTGLLNHIRCYRDGRDAPPDELSCKLWVHRRALSADGHGGASRGAGFDYMLNGLKHGGVAFVEHLGSCSLSLSTPRTNCVRSLLPMDTPSMPVSRNLSNKRKFVGSSAIIHSLKSGPRSSPCSQSRDITPSNSDTVRTNGTIAPTLEYFARTRLRASTSRANLVRRCSGRSRDNRSWGSPRKARKIPRL